MLQLQLPDEFKEELQRSLEEVYKASIENARRDVGIIREYLSIAEVCKTLGISRNTLTSNYIECGLASYKIGNKIYTKKKELEQYSDEHQIRRKLAAEIMEAVILQFRRKTNGNDRIFILEYCKYGSCFSRWSSRSSSKKGMEQARRRIGG